MQFLLQYLVKFSLSIALLYIFYRAVLRPLTFYQWNRFYLLSYSLLSFLIPFINITPWVKERGIGDSKLVKVIPAWPNYTLPQDAGTINTTSFWQRLSMVEWVLILFAVGAVVMLLRVLMQYLSLRRIKRNAVLLEANGAVQLYETNSPVSPFSFGSSIYFNRSMHSSEELQRIIQHEFVHVRQMHTIDLLLGELLCIVNWYNPFAWAIRYAIRQNLEFIADNNVVENGIDKKEYQYMLLKVIGVSKYSIANNFNFSNLKKRIAMMNKMKSAKLHLTKFLFALPLLSVLLVAFREYKKEDTKTVSLAGLVVDANSMQPLSHATIYCREKNITAVTDEKGYYLMDLPYENKPLHFTLQVSKDGYSGLHQSENWGNFYEESIRSQYGNTIELFGLTKSAMGNRGFSTLVGNAPDKEGLNYAHVVTTLDRLKNQMKYTTGLWNDTVPVPPPPPPPPAIVIDTPQPPAKMITLPDNVESINIHKDVNNKKGSNTNTVTVTLKNGNKEVYNLNDPKEKSAYIKKYGELPQPPPPPAGAPVPATTIPDGVTVEKEIPVNKAAVVIPDYGVQVQQVNGNVVIHGIVNEQVNTPLYVIDKVEQPIGININTVVKPDKIESVNVIKGKSGETLYGQKGKNGVIEITTKKPLVIIDSVEQAVNVKIDNVVKVDNIERVNVITKTDAVTKYGEKGRNGVVEITTKTPLYFIDGVELPKGKKLSDEVSPDDIDSMTVLKDETAVKKYGEKGKNGVILIITKKKAGKQ